MVSPRAMAIMSRDIVLLSFSELSDMQPQPYYVARALVDRGYKATLISLARRPTARKLRRPGLSIVTPADAGLRGRASVAAFGALALPLIARSRACICFHIAELWAMAYASRLRHNFLRILYLLEPFYGNYMTDKPRLTLRLGVAQLKQLTLDALIDVNHARLQHSAALCGNPSKQFAIENAPPRDEQWNLPAPSPRRHSHMVRFVYAGSVIGHARDGLELLLQAWPKTSDRLTLTIHAVQQGKELEPIAAQVSQLGLEKRVQILPAVERDQLPSTLPQYDVGVVLYPVRPGADWGATLAAPNKLYEYMACGLAVLASPNPTLAFVSEKRAGWNLSEWSAQAMQQAVSNPPDRQSIDEMRENAYRLFQTTLNFDSQAAPFLDWIDSRLRATKNAKTCAS